MTARFDASEVEEALAAQLRVALHVENTDDLGLESMRRRYEDCARHMRDTVKHICADLDIDYASVTQLAFPAVSTNGK